MGTDYPSKKLGDVADFVRGITFKPDDVIGMDTANAVACMRTKNVQSDLDLSDVWGVPASFVKRDEQYLREGDILVSSANSWNLVGKCSWVPKLPYRATIGGFISCLRRISQNLDERYLFHWFSSEPVQALVRNCARKTTNISNLSFDQCLALEIPLPPLEEQKRIAAILDQADDIRRKRQHAIDRLNQLGQAIFKENFSNPSKRGYWTEHSLGNLCDLVRGSSPRPQGDARYFGGNVPRLMIADITRDGMMVSPKIDSLTELGATKSRFMSAGSVVMAVSGAVGLPAILTKDACIHDGFVGFRKLDKKILPQFLYWFLNVNREKNKEQGVGAIWSNLTTDQVKRFLVPVPDMHSQTNFVGKMGEIYLQSTLINKSLKQQDNLFLSLQNRAFAGEL